MNSRIDKIGDLSLLLSIEQIGPYKVRALLSHFKQIEKIFTASVEQLCKVEGISFTLANRIIHAKNNREEFLNNFYKDLRKLEKIGGKIITYWDVEYSQLLKKIYDPPLILYYIGDISLLTTNSIAVIGTRNPTSYGKKVAKDLTVDLCSNDLTIVSGLARGIDTVAHETAIKTNGKTIAALGNGLDFIYPSENKILYEKIISNGLLITEYPLTTKPDAQNFPRRNRIIAGLSLGVLVIETDITGGAMQTASLALEQNREVFAIPGNLGIKQSNGTNLLIQRSEAKLVLDVSDILNELRIKPAEKEVQTHREIDTSQLNFFEEKILKVISNEPILIDSIITNTGLSVSECNVHLLTLEFKGLIKQLPGKMFVLN